MYGVNMHSRYTLLQSALTSPGKMVGDERLDMFGKDGVDETAEDLCRRRPFCGELVDERLLNYEWIMAWKFASASASKQKKRLNQRMR